MQGHEFINKLFLWHRYIKKLSIETCGCNFIIDKDIYLLLSYFWKIVVVVGFSLLFCPLWIILKKFYQLLHMIILSKEVW